MQTEALNWLIKTGEWDTLQQADIDERYFGDVIPQFQWIRDFIKEHRKVPSLTTFLYQWPDWEYVPYDEPASFVIEGLRNDLLYRETFHTIKNAAQLLSEKPEEAVKQLQTGVEKLVKIQSGRGVVTRDLMADAAWIAEAYGNARERTGGIDLALPDFPTLDPGEMVVLAARPSTGKTWMGLHFAWQARQQKKKVLFFNLEMTEMKAIYRLVTLSTHIPNTALKEGSVHPDTVRDAIENLRRDSIPFHMISLDGLDRAVTQSMIESYIREVRPDFVVIDQFSKIQDDYAGKDRWRFVNISHAIQRMAIRYNIPILLLVQLSRDAAHQMRHQPSEAPRVEHIAESDAPLQDGDKVITMLEG